MGFLGYDAAGLATLVAAIDRARAELVDTHIPGGDVLTAEAFNDIAGANRLLLGWSQRIRSLLLDPANTTAPPAGGPLPLDDSSLAPIFRRQASAPLHYGLGAIATGDLANAVLYDRQQHGWRIATDPLPDVPLTADQQSMQDDALATALRTGNATRVTSGTNGDIARAEIGAIAQDAARSKRFIAMLGLEGLTKLADEYAVLWAGANPVGRGGGDQRSQAAADIAVLAVIIDKDRGSQSAPLPKALDTMDPEAASLLLVDLDIDGATLGSYSAAILQRWHSDPPAAHRPWLISTAETIIGPGSLLFARIRDVPGAAAAFVGSAVAMDELMRLAVLYGSVYEPSDYEAVMQQSTDPRFVELDQAKSTLLTVIDDYRSLDASGVRTDHRDDTTVLGAMASPWLMQLTNIDPGFGLTDREGKEIVDFTFKDGTSRQSLLDGTAALASKIFDPTHPPDNWEAFMVRLDDIQTLKGMLANSSLIHDLSRQERENASEEWTVKLVAKAVTGLAGALTGGVGMPLIGFVIGKVEGATDAALASDPKETIDESAAAVDSSRNNDTFQMMSSLYAVSAAYAGAGSTLARPLSPPPPKPPASGTCTSKEYAKQLDAWSATIPDPELVSKMNQVRREILNGFTNGYDCR